MNEDIYNVYVQTGAGIQTFEINPPFPVTEGSRYSCILEGTNSSLRIVVDLTTNSYFDGGAMDNSTNTSPHPVWDLDFSIKICPTNMIPTLSQWGLIILGLFLSNFGLVAIMQKSIGLA